MKILIYLSAEEARRLLHQACVEAGTIISAYAQRAGLDRCVVTNERAGLDRCVMTNERVGKRLVSYSTAHALGLRRVVAYVQEDK